ncbi:MAG: chromate transporter [Candidatus Omnitrophica bacterium]|nr:chromate transporter [Candidatus Omnitrophota bacterium]MBU1923600.1 chromate transporter [Candidatus Omnitrophota bacterium]
MVLISLFLAFLRIGLFAIGGAYSFFPLIEKEVVEKYHWLSREEFLNVGGLVKICPGAISIQYATYTGYKIAGISGAVCANLGNILAPALAVIFAAVIYARYKDLPAVKSAFDAIRPAVFAMIIAVAFQTINIRHLMQAKILLIIISSFLIFIYTKIHPAIVIILFGVMGAIWR